MHVVLVLVVLSVVLGWAGFELRERSRSVSQVLFGFSALFLIMLVAAFFNVI